MTIIQLRPYEEDDVVEPIDDDPLGSVTDLVSNWEDKCPSWMDSPQVKCKGLTPLLYPSRSNAEVAQAKAMCNGLDGRSACPFQKQCLRYAIDHAELYGVWGGTSERDRRKIRSARRKGAHIYTFEDVRFPGVSTVQARGVVQVQPRARVVRIQYRAVV